MNKNYQGKNHKQGKTRKNKDEEEKQETTRKKQGEKQG